MSLSSNAKRIASCKEVGGAKKLLGHKRENDFHKQYNEELVDKICYANKSDGSIAESHATAILLKDKFGINRFNTSNKSGNNLQFTLGKIPELEDDKKLEFIKDKDNSRKLFEKYLKKSESEAPADLLVYKDSRRKNWIFFKMDDVVDYIVEKCIWRQLVSGRLKGDFVDNSRKGISQYLTYEYRTKHKSYFLGLNGNKGYHFIRLLMDKEHGIPHYIEPVILMEDAFKVNVLTLNGGNYSIEVKTQISLKELFTKISGETNIPNGQMRLIYRSKRLPHYEEEDVKRSLFNFNFLKDDKVHMVLRLGTYDPFVYKKEDWFENPLEN